MREKAALILEKAKNTESHSERLPEILKYFREIKQRFEDGHYKDVIVGELEKNYVQIKDMHDKLQKEEKEDQTLNDKITSLERSQSAQDINIFDYIRKIIDERTALITVYDSELKN